MPVGQQPSSARASTANVLDCAWKHGCYSEAANHAVVMEAALQGYGGSRECSPNAMQPMQRPRIQSGLLALREAYGVRLVIRVSLDHYGKVLHEEERGADTYDKTVEGIDWLARHGFALALAGRTYSGESEDSLRAGYGRLAAERGWPIDASDPRQLVLFPEMDLTVDVPEITTACWGILHKKPSDVMCAASRMVVKRKGAARPVVLPCTLLPYDPAFEMGATLTEAARANGGMFAHGAVKLCHPHCAKFCVLGGGSCSA
jgi:hypothetical protein